jgi:hypothetical protein
MVYYQDEHYQIDWEETGKFVKLTIRGFIQGSARQAAMLKVLELIKQKGATKLLSDNRQGKVIGLEDQKWLVEVWWPQVIAAGLRYSAVALSQDAVAQLSYKKMTGQASGGAQPLASAIESRNFSEVSEAEKWLRTKK